VEIDRNVKIVLGQSPIFEVLSQSRFGHFSFGKTFSCQESVRARRFLNCLLLRILVLRTLTYVFSHICEYGRVFHRMPQSCYYVSIYALYLYEARAQILSNILVTSSGTC
jgi:hypothetical protein